MERQEILDRFEQARDRARVASMGQGRAWKGIEARWVRVSGLLALALDCLLDGDRDGASAWVNFSERN
jgi:hypothetical protein